MYNMQKLFLTDKRTTGESCSDRDVRIVGGDREGRVEVCYNQAWGTLCDEVYGSASAGILCSQLGFRRKLLVIVKKLCHL